MVYGRWLDQAKVRHGGMDDHAAASERYRLPGRSRISPPRFAGNVGQTMGKAENALGRRRHRQGLRPRKKDRRSRALATAAGRPTRRQSKQVRERGVMETGP